MYRNVGGAGGRREAWAGGDLFIPLIRLLRQAQDAAQEWGTRLQYAAPVDLPYVDDRVVSHDMQVVMQIYRGVAVGSYKCDDAAQRQAIGWGWKGETAVLVSEK